jgi:transcriptional regulator with XRE-family HTH domain
MGDEKMGMVMSQELRQRIASRLRAAREAVGLSQTQVAKRLGIHRPTMSEIEAGRRRVSADELAQFSAIYGIAIEWFALGGDARAGPGDERFMLAVRLLRGLNREELDRAIEWLIRMQKKENWDDEEGPYTFAPQVEKSAVDGIQADTHEVRYIRCLHYDEPVVGQQSREDLRCPALIPVQGGGEAANYCAEHQGETLGEQATPEELDEVRADLETIPTHAPYLRLLTTVLDAQSMKANTRRGEKKQLTG